MKHSALYSSFNIPSSEIILPTLHMGKFKGRLNNLIKVTQLINDRITYTLHHSVFLKKEIRMNERERERKKLYIRKMNSRCIKVLNMKGKIIVLLEENIGKYLCSLWIRKDFYRPQIKNFKYIKIKDLCTTFKFNTC